MSSTRLQKANLLLCLVRLLTFTHHIMDCVRLRLGSLRLARSRPVHLTPPNSRLMPRTTMGVFICWMGSASWLVLLYSCKMNLIFRLSVLQIIVHADLTCYLMKWFVEWEMTFVWLRQLPVRFCSLGARCLVDTSHYLKDYQCCS